MTEIELKARVTDPEGQRARISKIARYIGECTKEDAYWFLRDGRSTFPSGIRVRKERRTGPGGRRTRRVRISCKTKEIRNGEGQVPIEVNDEREFEVSSGAAFEELLLRLGLEKGVEKTKQGWAWTYEDGAGPVAVELFQVEGFVRETGPEERARLGWFAELEILSDNEDPETVSAARKRLLALLEKIGIGAEQLEGRYYTELLRS